MELTCMKECSRRTQLETVHTAGDGFVMHCGRSVRFHLAITGITSRPLRRYAFHCRARLDSHLLLRPFFLISIPFLPWTRQSDLQSFVAFFDIARCHFGGQYIAKPCTIVS